MKKKKKEKYIPVIHLIERMSMNGNLSIDAKVDMLPNGDWRINAVHQDTVLALMLFNAFMEVNENIDFENIHAEIEPLDEHDRIISFQAMKTSLLFASNFYAQRALAFHENIKPELN